MATVEATRLKLAEAEFFCRKLVETHGRVVMREPEEFGFYLSAFVAAARSVRDALKAERKAQYKKWYRGWKHALPKEQRDLLAHFKKQRDLVPSVQGAAPATRSEDVMLSDIYLAATLEGADIGISDDAPGAPASPHHRTERGGVLNNAEANAVQAAAQYVALLSQMLGSFEARFPDDHAT